MSSEGPENGEQAAVAYEPFDGERRCPKCGHDDLGTIYRDSSHVLECQDHRVPQPYDPSGRFSCSGCGDEHFDRNCRRCSYRWREEVAR